MRQFATSLSAAAAVTLFAFVPPLAGFAQSDQPVPLQAAKAPVDTSLFAEDHRLFAVAMDAYREGRFSAAYGRFIVLADLGHPRAARMALLMYRDGPARYGTPWDATQEQLETRPTVAAGWAPPRSVEVATILDAAYAPGD
ncbi:hypothetical protein HK414_08050 [Ramlibacter terrae]|uniref:Sel1 repeat family protein n=1 Tax=Ramlibacter terrae TaxID=2732511 RepID=A0ABX6P3K4_9BURK|nr:hypothetical protein HK414_08050 [Ramlibacter terrae]